MSILLDIFHYFARYTPHHKSREEVLAAMADEYQAATGKALDYKNSVVDRMKLLKIDEASTTYTKRKSVAAYYGIENYTGTEAQNHALINAITEDMIG